MAEYLSDQLNVIHNASFDWLILFDHVVRHGLAMPEILGVFCSQKATRPWAQAMNLPWSHSDPSLDTLMKALRVDDLRVKLVGLHGARIDSRLTASVLAAMRRYQ